MTSETTSEKSDASGPGPEPSEAPSANILEGKLPRGIMGLGLPLAIAMALQASFNLVDMFIIGKLPNGDVALGALAICDLVAMIPTIMANGISNASAAIISRRAGEGDAREVSRYTWQSLSMVGLLSLFAGAIGIFFADTLTADVFDAKGEVRVIAAEYMAIIVGGGFSILLLLQVAAIMRALGDGKTPMYLLLGSNIVNLFLSILMVFGKGPAPDVFSWITPIGEALDLDGMGVAGAAWSTIISRSAALLIGCVILARNKTGLLQVYWRDLLPMRRAFGRIFKIAWPNSAQFVLRIGVILFFTAIVTHRFTTETDHTTLTAFGICMRLDTLTLFVSMGWGAAASTYVGQNLGAGNPARAKASGWVASLFNGGFMLGVLAFYLAFPSAIIGIFSEDPAVHVIGTEYLRIVGATYVFLGTAVVLSQALAGAGATMSSFAIDSVVLGALLIPATLFMLAVSDLTRVDTWLLIGAGNVLSCAAYAIWYRKGHWLHKVI